jgi:hypothetical protein
LTASLRKKVKCAKESLAAFNVITVYNQNLATTTINQACELLQEIEQKNPNVPLANDEKPIISSFLNEIDRIQLLVSGPSLARRAYITNFRQTLNV